jgi:hypothetical protein
MKILLANIGNRNLKYRGDLIDTNRFRELTKGYLEDYETEKSNLGIEILTPFFEKYTFSSVILFYSDTPEPFRNNQDTLYEAEILQYLIQEKYGVQTILYPLKCRVVDSNGLMRRYQGYLKKIISENSDANYILCDAGGTAYQKSSVKIALDFLLPSERFEVVNVITDKIGISELESEEPLEYRKIITSEQTASLIEVGNYEGAMKILNIDANKDTYKIINIAYSLINNNYNEALNQKSKFGKNIIRYPAVAKLFLENSDRKPQYLDSQNFNKLYTTLSIAQFFRKTSKYGFSILFYSIFIENLLDYTFESRYKLNFQNDWNYIKDLIRQNKVLFDDTNQVEFERFSPSVPVKIQLCTPLRIQHLNSLLNLYQSYNSYYLTLKNDNSKIGIDSVRNKFAHEGRHVTLEVFEKFIPLMDELEAAFLSSKNLFEELNEDLIKAMS